MCKGRLILLLAGVFIISANSYAAKHASRQDVKKFIHHMVNKHHFDQKKLMITLNQAKHKDSIIKAMNRPAESYPWYRYRKIFLKQNRIQGGVQFWKSNLTALKKAEQIYGVPPEIITAIIGVETRYGGNTGSYRVLDALFTLGFDYPRRGKFFRSELEAFLLLTREEKIKPTQPTGSYAGAMGWPQFMPSSFRGYAVDFDGNGKKDIWRNREDVIGSVANYFKKHGWKHHQAIAMKATLSSGKAKKFVLSELKPKYTVAQLLKSGVVVDKTPSRSLKASLMDFELEDSGTEYWLGMHNFYVITRYNHSKLYALAAFQLSQEIKELYGLDDLEYGY